MREQPENMTLAGAHLTHLPALQAGQARSSRAHLSRSPTPHAVLQSQRCIETKRLDHLQVE